VTGRLARHGRTASVSALPNIRRRRFLLTTALLLLAAVFVLLVATDPVELGALLFAPPVVLVGLELGPVGGALAGLAATLLFVLSTTAGDTQVDPLTIVPRGFSLMVVGAATGLLAQRAVKSAEGARAMQAQLAEREATLSALFESALDAIVVVDDDRRFLEANPAVGEVLGMSREELLGRRMDHFSDSDGDHRLRRTWDSLLERKRVRGEYDFKPAGGAPRTLEFSATADFEPGRHLLVLRDVSERAKAEDELQHRVAQHVAIADLGLEALGAASVQPLMEQAARSIASTLGVEYVAVWRLMPDGDRLELACGVGWPPGGGGLTVDAAPQWQVGFALAAEEPVVIEDLRTEGRFRPLRFLVEVEAISGISVAIEGGERRWGAVTAHTRERRAFGRDDVYFMRVVSNTLAMAVERDRVLQELHRRSRQVARLASDRQQIVAQALNAEDRARQRISQLLHDEVLQDLLTVRQDLAQAGERSGEPDHLEHARESLQQTIGDLRAAVFDLRPLALEHAGLRSAITTVADYQSKRAGFAVSLDLTEPSDGGRDELVFSLVRELLTNVARHASASEVRITVGQDNGDIVLEVADDGRGMEPDRPGEALREGHIGLASASQRVEALGGRFDVRSRPGEGTRVSAVVPFADQPTDGRTSDGWPLADD
jgi:PAS domain S-box-containing protein